jgi:hypothetical protein
MRRTGDRTLLPAMILLISVIAVANFFFGEKVSAGAGLGWDGVVYARLVTRLPELIHNDDLNTYYAQRVLPAAVIRAMLDAFALPRSTANIIRAFEVYNFALLLLACVLWKKIADHVGLGWKGWLTGFAALFLNFQGSKQTFFYPVLTDVTALVTGLALLLFHLSQRRTALLVTTIVGAFAWPTIGLTGALLLVCKPRTPADAGALPEQGSPTTWLRVYLGILLVASSALVLMALFPGDVLLACRATSAAVSAGLPADLQAAALRAAAWPDPCLPYRQVLTAIPTITGAGLLLLLLFRPDWRESARHVLANWDTRSTVMALAAVVIPAIGVRLIANHFLPNPSGLLVLLKLALLPTDGMVLMPLVSVVSLWGPTVLVLLLWWPAFCRHAAGLGFGFQAVVSMTLLLGVIGEPRFLTAGWPFLVLGAALTVEALRPTAKFAVALSVLTMLLGQAWLPINAIPWPAGDWELLGEFPKQFWFMHYGLWMGWPAYIGQVVLFAAAALWLWSSQRGGVKLPAPVARASAVGG